MRGGKATNNTKKIKNINKTDILQFLMKGRAFVALIVVVALFSLTVPGFLHPANIVIMANHVAIWALMGIGMTFVILTGGIDLSVGSVAGLAALIAGGLIKEGISLPWLDVVIYPKHGWLSFSR